MVYNDVSAKKLDRNGAVEMVREIRPEGRSPPTGF
jgi:hypothetical protein